MVDYRRLVRRPLDALFLQEILMPSTVISLRRCKHLFIEPRRVERFSLDDVLAGRAGLVSSSCWMALAPHLPEGVEVSAEALQVLGGFDADTWTETALPLSSPQLELLGKGLLFSDCVKGNHIRSDERIRELGWWGPAAMLHWQARWEDRNSVAAIDSVGIQTAAGLRQRFGAPPPATVAPEGPMIMLSREPEDEVDRRLQMRCTCRNFDISKPLSMAVFSRLIGRCFAATGSYQLDEESIFLKRNAPSAGGLHATESYLIIQNVEGVLPGLYHYHPMEHALTLIPGALTPEPGTAAKFVAGQHWFANAHVMIILAPRFDRLHWKYRGHAKAYRAVTLDVGHLSQLLLGCATEMGLGAFVTAAINEKEIEQTLGFDPMAQSPLAICGFGWRAEVMETTEFDPAQAVWESVG